MDKLCVKEQNQFGEKREILKTDLEAAKVINNLFGNIVKNLEINK